MNIRAVPLHPSIVKRAMPNGRPAGLPKRRPYGGVSWGRNQRWYFWTAKQASSLVFVEGFKDIKHNVLFVHSYVLGMPLDVRYMFRSRSHQEDPMFFNRNHHAVGLNLCHSSYEGNSPLRLRACQCPCLVTWRWCLHISTYIDVYCILYFLYNIYIHTYI